MVWLWVLKTLVIGAISIWLGGFIEDVLNQALLPLITSPVPREIICGHSRIGSIYRVQTYSALFASMKLINLSRRSIICSCCSIIWLLLSSNSFVSFDIPPQNVP